MPDREEDVFFKTILEALTKKYKVADIKAALEEIESSGIDEATLQALKKPIRVGRIISRERVEKVWEALPENPSFSMTAREVASIAQLSLPVTKHALYVLLSEGRGKRQIRDQARVTHRPGKPEYEYYKLPIPSQEPAEPRKLFDMERLRKVIPNRKSEALSVSEIAWRINGSPVTVRVKILQLEASGEVGSVKGLNERKQVVLKYYLK
jgi:hypothetical protein